MTGLICLFFFLFFFFLSCVIFVILRMLAHKGFCEYGKERFLPEQQMTVLRGKNLPCDV